MVAPARELSPPEPRSLAAPLWLRRAAVGAVVVALLLHLQTIQEWSDVLWRLFDLEVYRGGGDAVRHGTTIYTRPFVGPLVFTYPPFSAVVFVPLSFVPMTVLRWLATAGNIALLAWAIRLAWRSLGYAADEGLRWTTTLLVGVLFWLEPVRTTVWLGQINLLLLCLVVADLTRPDRSRWKGIGVGLAAGLKLTPGFFVIYLLVTGRIRAAAVAVATFAGTVAIGFVVAPREAWHYWTQAAFNAKRVGPLWSLSNQSINGALARIFDFTNDPPKALWLVLAAVAATTGLVAARWLSRSGRELFALTVCGLTAATISPFSWEHHWVWFVPLVIVGIDAALRSDRWHLWLLPVGLWALTAAWILGSPLKPGLAPPTGLFSVRSARGFEVVFQNLYPLLFVATMVAVAALARREQRERTLR